MKKRAISFVLCIAMLFSMLVSAIPTVYAKETSVRILHNNTPVTELILEQSDKEILTVEAAGLDVTSYQWQILIDAQTLSWANIYDKTEEDCEISYAVVKNLLDDADSTYIRCAIMTETETIYSDEVCVSVVTKEEVKTDSENSQEHSLLVPVSTDKAMRVFGLTRAASEYVTITIKYLDASSIDGEEAAIYSPYVATIESGSNFKQDVISPTFLGFAPYYDADGDGIANEDATKISLDLVEPVTENIEIKVYYKPIDVNFAIRYFFQNIHDDLYTENVALYHTGKAETGTIIADEYLREHAGTTTGFEKMYHIPESVAADGSTVFECYYDRNYYLIQFDLDGGYGVDPIYARYGTPFVVNDPVKHGYNFVGWDLLTKDTNGDGILDEGDNVVDDLPDTIPAQGRTYVALWETTETTYNIAYWLDNVDGTYAYIGSRQEEAESATKVSGTDDLASASICGILEHIHSEENGCFNNCMAEEHICDLTCFTTSTLNMASGQTGNALTAYNNLASAVGANVVEGNVYKYAYRSGRNTTYYNFFYYDSIWYYLGTGSTYSGISFSGTLSNPNNNNYNTVAATKNCDAHTHTNECLSCTMPEHAHLDSCKADTTYYEFVEADTDVLVQGDGSTVVNVYYTCKKYTLRFYYAKSDGANYYVVGGSTYPFGTGNSSNTENTSIQTLLENVSAWGKVESVPQVAEEYRDNYTIDSVKYGNYTYYYLEFTGSYGSDIGNVWPIGIFEPVKIAEAHNQCDYEHAYFSAWNGEYRVKYTQDHKGGNETIKGCYMYLDETIIFKEGFTDVAYTDSKGNNTSLVSFLGFWDNGANISWSIPELYVYNLMVESLETPGTYEPYKSFNTYDDSDVNNQTVTTIDGLTYRADLWKYDTISDGKDGSMKHYEIYYYYDRNDYDLTFYNYNAEVSTEVVTYGTALGGYDFIPAYPTTLEENAYEFGGWYTTPECYDASKFELDTATMPAENLILYAKWVPKTHKVNFFATYDEMSAFEDGDTTINLHASYPAIVHGKVVGSVENPKRTAQGGMDYIFAGWFYMEHGQKKAFAPLDMPINGDMNIFAEWSSTKPQPYHIEYVLRTDPDTKVADDTTGFAYGGSTRTFIAKAGNPYNQLYDTYNKGYFPTVGSHSITMQYEENKEHPVLNTYKFYYVKATNITYTVRYVDKETNTLLEEETIKTTEDAVVTERFKAFENMVPDAFYKRLVISVKEDANGNWVGTEDNVITFYYTPNKTSAYYAVHYMLEKLGSDADNDGNLEYKIDGSGDFEETGTHVEGIGDVDSNVSIVPQTFTGFKLVEGKAVSVVDKNETPVSYNNGEYSIKITTSGTELYIFYERLPYDYTVHYYHYNTTESVDEDKYPSITGEALYGESVTKEAATISGFTCVSATTQTITIRDKSEQNVIIFYYSPVQYVAEYVAVPDEGGWLSTTIEVISGTDPLNGSVPNTNPYYEFVGWYKDKDCTISAETYGTIDSEKRFIPDKDKLSETERNIFYAKFIRKAGNITIDRKDAQDDGQVFVYEVKNNTSGETIYVTVTGNGSVTIHDVPFGEYTIAEQVDWSWRYTTELLTIVDHQNEKGTTANFRGPISKEKWLNGNSNLIKNIRGMSK